MRGKGRGLVAAPVLSERFAFVNNYICVKCKLENATKVREEREKTKYGARSGHNVTASHAHM